MLRELLSDSMECHTAETTARTLLKQLKVLLLETTRWSEVISYCCSVEREEQEREARVQDDNEVTVEDLLTSLRN